MNIGDMVTLSAAALNRDPLILWTEQCRNAGYGKPKPIGFVTEVQHRAKIGYIAQRQDVYVVRWITPDAPTSRESNHGWMSKQHANQFFRVDLKFISRRKRSKK